MFSAVTTASAQFNVSLIGLTSSLLTGAVVICALILVCRIGGVGTQKATQQLALTLGVCAFFLKGFLALTSGTGVDLFGGALAILLVASLALLFVAGKLGGPIESPTSQENTHELPAHAPHVIPEPTRGVVIRPRHPLRGAVTMKSERLNKE